MTKESPADQTGASTATIAVPPPAEPIVSTAVCDGVTQLRRPETHWVSTGPNGGHSTGPTAYNVTVPSGWERTDLRAYIDERLDRAGFDTAGPALLTGVEQGHARIARAGPAAVLATAGVSNPAPLVDEPPEQLSANRDQDERDGGRSSQHGTVNVIAVVDRQLCPAARLNLLSVVAEAKTATVLDAAGVPGTTTDAVVIGSQPVAGTETDNEATNTTQDTTMQQHQAADSAGGGTAQDDEPIRFTGSGTVVGAAVRCCTRDAVQASLFARYDETALPESVADAEYGVRMAVETEVETP